MPSTRTREKGSLKRLERLLGIALLLSARRRLKGEELAAHFGVSQRTMYRDLRALQDAGFPVSGTPGDGYLLPPGSQLRPLAFEPREAEVLVMGTRLLERAVDDRLRAELQSAVAKLEAVLTPEAVRRLRDHRSSVLMPVLRSRAEGPLSLVLEAVRERRVLDIVYHGVARRDQTRREIEPLGLVRLDVNWMVPAYCRLRSDLRVFRADRILEARATGERFELRPGLLLEDFVRMKEQEPNPSAGGGPAPPY
jgi:predicted DNA-binding transcriptional regulator YafY